MNRTFFNFCPNCGKQTIEFHINRLYCHSCQFTYFHNTAGAVAVLIYCKEELLFTVRNKNPKKGFLDLSGGFIDYYESAEETVIREIKEELNLDFSNEKIKYLTSIDNRYEYKNVKYHTIDLFFEVQLKEKPTTTLQQSEICDIRWIVSNNITIDKLAFESQKLFFKSFYKK